MTQLQIDQARLARLDTLTLFSGAHKEAEARMCAMEAVAWLAGETWSDHPTCACPVIAGAMRRLNDRINDDATRTELLRPLLPKLIGSKASREVMIKRGYVAADFAVRVFLSLALEARGLKSEAARWRDFGEITDRSRAMEARDGIRATKYYAAAAAYAAAAYAADAAAAAYAADAAAAAYAAAAYAADAAAAAAAAYADAAYAADAAAAYDDARLPIYREGVRMIEAMLAVTE